MDLNFKKSIMIDNFNNPNNKGLINDSSYYKVNVNSKTCIDNLDFIMKIEDDIIKDIKFDGEACVISTSLSSIISDFLINKKIDEVLSIIENYENMIEEKEYDKEKLELLNVFEDISKQPNRKKCALLPVDAIKKILLEYKNKGDNE